MKSKEQIEITLVLRRDEPIFKVYIVYIHKEFTKGLYNHTPRIQQNRLERADSNSVFFLFSHEFD